MSTTPPDNLYMQRALELATNGAGFVAPNPLVGAVIVHNDTIIGEGWHREFGGPHAEVNAINSVPEDKLPLLPESTIYVNLEPCSHFGKTPPCVDLLVQKQLKRVVIANTDPNELVAGRGIKKLRDAGCEVTTGIMETDGLELNKRFFTFHQKKRPYIILKWAQSADGFFTRDNQGQHWITGHMARKLAHRWRSEEAAIMVGTQTALADNPKLDTRLWPGGKAPLRIVLDRSGRLPSTLNLFNGQQETWIVTEKAGETTENGITCLQLTFGDNLLTELMQKLYERQVQSVMVEGGARLLRSFIEADLWDEARVFTGTPFWGKGVAAPALPLEPETVESVGEDKLYRFKNQAC